MEPTPGGRTVPFLQWPFPVIRAAVPLRPLWTRLMRWDILALNVKLSCAWALFYPGQGPLPSSTLGGSDGALEEALSMWLVAAVTAAHPYIGIIYVL